MSVKRKRQAIRVWGVAGVGSLFLWLFLLVMVRVKEVLVGKQVPDLSLEAFGAWLCVHEYVSVGLLGSWLRSPLVVWLDEVFGVACELWIDHQFLGLLVSGNVVWLPGWARLFLMMTERYGGFYEATGAEVFALLAEVECRSYCALR